MKYGKLQKLFSDILETLSSQDRDFLQLAYDFSENAHLGQLRKSGEPYFIHPLYTSISLWDRYNNLDLAVAGLLHDTVEDCESIKIDDIYNIFGEKIGFIVDAMSKNNKSFYLQNKEFKDERDKLLYGGMIDISCILIKLADRQHNLMTLENMPDHKQIKKSFETQAIYMPLMNVLKFDQKGLSLEIANKLFLAYLKENNINNYLDLKLNLINTFFHDFSEDFFNLLFENYKDIVWEINEYNIYESLVKDDKFANSIDVLYLNVGLDNFSARFKFIKGFTLNNKINTKIYTSNDRLSA